MRNPPRTALTIAGSDSGGGAGIQADLKTFAAHGVFGFCAITAVTAQNSLGVTAVSQVPEDVVAAQIAAVAADFPVHAVKTGMLGTAAAVRTVAREIRARSLAPLVLDPVMIAKSGAALLHDEAVSVLVSDLLPLADVITPNVPEAEVLTGLRIATLDDCRLAARRLAELGPRRVVVKGGHLERPDIVDVLFDGSSVVEFSHPRLPGRHTHGTGCTFASALASHLALGRTLAEAIPQVQHYIAGAIAANLDLGHGHGPMDHFWDR